MTTPSPAPPAPSFLQATAPAWVLLTLLLYGLVLRPLALGQAPLALETIFVFSAAFAMAELFWLGFSWNEIQGAIIHRLGRAFTGDLYPLCHWALGGRLDHCWNDTHAGGVGGHPREPGLDLSPGFLIPVLFSLLTGTSWGSAGTIGVVLMGIGISVGADPAVLAGAIIGGAYFGDKLSPYRTQRTSRPSPRRYPFSAISGPCFGLRSPPRRLPPRRLHRSGPFGTRGAGDRPCGAGGHFAAALGGLFSFHLALLLPPLIVLAGAWRGAPPAPAFAIHSGGHGAGPPTSTLRRRPDHRGA